MCEPPTGALMAEKPLLFPFLFPPVSYVLTDTLRCSSTKRTNEQKLITIVPYGLSW